MAGSARTERWIHILGEEEPQTIQVERDERVYLLCHTSSSLNASVECQGDFVLMAHNPKKIVLTASLKDHASLTSTICSQGSSSQSIQISLDGEGAQADLCGLLVVPAGAASVSDIAIEHTGRKTGSHQLIKSLVSDRGQAKVRSHCRVHKTAREAESRLFSHIFALGTAAHTENIPSFEIFSDDVTASHGATTRTLDPDILFYMASRGIDTPEAEQHLIEGFCADILARVYKTFPSTCQKDLFPHGIPK